MICNKQVSTASKNIFQPFLIEGSTRKLFLELKLLLWFVFSIYVEVQQLIWWNPLLASNWLDGNNASPIFKFYVDQEGRRGGPTWHLDSETWIMGLRMCTFVSLVSLLSSRTHKYCSLLKIHPEDRHLCTNLKKQRLPQVANDVKKGDIWYGQDIQRLKIDLCKWVY